jgi:DNA-binding NarL/FixJ family response regulator
MLTVSIIDDDSRLCLLLTRALSKSNEIHIVSTHHTGEAALLEIPLLRPSVALIDIKLPGMNGIDFIRHLQRFRLPVLPAILILTGHEDESLVFDALKAGADGYLSKDRTSTAELSQAIKQVGAGGGVMSPNIARKVLEHFRNPTSCFAELSAREFDVLDNLVEGLLYKQIATKLGISMDTVRRHIKSIYGKLQVHSRTEAAVRYLRLRK